MVKYGRYLRGCGFTSSEIYQQLMEWVAAQDRRLIKSSDEEIEYDAKEIAEWMGGLEIKKNESAVVFTERGKGRFEIEDINFILNGKMKSERRILFRMVLAIKIFGKDQTAHRLIANSIGVSESTVQSRMEAMVDRGLVKKFTGEKVKCINFKFFNTANSYLPGDVIEQRLDPADYQGDWELKEKLNWHNCMWDYAQVMAHTLGPNLKKYVGEREYAEIKAIIDNGRPVDVFTWYDSEDNIDIRL